MEKEIRITEIVEAISELEYTCERCFTPFTVGEIIITGNMGIISPCKCYHCNNDDADVEMRVHNKQIEEYEFEFEDIA